jgi:hypothetical protein
MYYYLDVELMLKNYDVGNLSLGLLFTDATTYYT